MTFDMFDWSVAIGTIVALFILAVMYKVRRPYVFPEFDMTDFPPPGSTTAEKREWRRHCREKRINAKFKRYQV